LGIAEIATSRGHSPVCGRNSSGIADAVRPGMLAALGPINDLTSRIIQAAIEVHRSLGPGLLESVYARWLEYELTHAGLKVESECKIPIVYKGISLDKFFRLDLLVTGLVVVESKAVEQILALHKAQLLTHLKVSNKPVGLLLNFNMPVMKNGITRTSTERP
jgi:GxxExxY protein